MFVPALLGHTGCKSSQHFCRNSTQIISASINRNQNFCQWDQSANADGTKAPMTVGLLQKGCVGEKRSASVHLFLEGFSSSSAAQIKAWRNRQTAPLSIYQPE